MQANVKFRREEAETRMRQIYEAAEQIISRDGYSQLSAQTVAGEVGITRPLVYHYFASMNEIAEGVIERRVKRSIEDLGKIYRVPQSSSIRESLEKGVRALEIISQNGEIFGEPTMKKYAQRSSSESECVANEQTATHSPKGDEVAGEKRLSKKRCDNLERQDGNAELLLRYVSQVSDVVAPRLQEIMVRDIQAQHRLRIHHLDATFRIAMTGIVLGQITGRLVSRTQCEEILAQILHVENYMSTW